MNVSDAKNDADAHECFDDFDESNSTLDTCSAITQPSSPASVQMSSASNEIDLRPSTSGVPKRKQKVTAPRTDNSEQLKKAFDGLEQCLETIASVKSAKPVEDEFQIFANYIASELRGMSDLQVARQFKRKLQIFFTNGLIDAENVMV